MSLLHKAHAFNPISIPGKPMRPEHIGEIGVNFVEASSIVLKAADTAESHPCPHKHPQTVAQ